MRSHTTILLLTLGAIACDRPTNTTNPREPAPEEPHTPSVVADATFDASSAADAAADAAIVSRVDVPAPPAPRWLAAAVVSSNTPDGVALTPITLDRKGKMRLRPHTDIDVGVRGASANIVAAHDGARACVTHRPRDRKGPTSARLHTLTSPADSPRVADTSGQRSHAAFVDRRACLLGGEHARILRVDFSTEPATPTLLDTRGDGPAFEVFKAVDFFVDTGDTFLAVDDRVAPFYAFTFDWVRQDGARTLSSTSRPIALPDGANLTYTGATAAAGHVVLLSRYAHRGGNGQRVDVYPSSMEGVPQDNRIEIYRGDDEDGNPKLHHMNLPYQPPKVTPSIRFEESSLGRLDSPDALNPKLELLAGKKMTAFEGLASIGDTLFIGAGARGILSARLPERFSKEPEGEPTPRVTRHRIGRAPVLDIVSHDGVLLALVDAEGGPRLVSLSWNRARRKLSVTQRLPAPDRATHFVPASRSE